MTRFDNCTIANKTKGTPTRVGVPFVSIKDKILGKDYELDVVFLTPKKQAEINKLYRNKEGTTNILSFPLSKTSGQITFDYIKIKSEAHLFGMNYPKFLKFLFIHGCLHLKGFEHSSTMEREEKKYLKFFS